MSLYRRNIPKPPVGVTEFEILKASHKFLRDEDEREHERSQALITTETDDRNASTSADTASWNEQLAAKYYASLYREFALCNLKHYKTGNFALRWRTEDEVLSGAGETTCGNTRCEHHLPPSSLSSSRLPPSTSNVPLTTLELPFCYVDHGKTKSALVKVVLCGVCVKKLMWKRNKEKERQGDVAPGVQEEEGGERDEPGDEKEARPKRINSKNEEGAGHRDRERERERPEKSKRKREHDTLLEEEKYQVEKGSRLQMREDKRVSERRNHDSTHSIATIEKDEIPDRLRKRRRSCSPSYKEDRLSSSFRVKECNYTRK